MEIRQTGSIIPGGNEGPNKVGLEPQSQSVVQQGRKYSKASNDDIPSSVSGILKKEETSNVQGVSNKVSTPTANFRDILRNDFNFRISNDRPFRFETKDGLIDTLFTPLDDHFRALKQKGNYAQISADLNEANQIFEEEFTRAHGREPSEKESADFTEALARMASPSNPSRTVAISRSQGVMVSTGYNIIPKEHIESIKDPKLRMELYRGNLQNLESCLKDGSANLKRYDRGHPMFKESKRKEYQEAYILAQDTLAAMQNLNGNESLKASRDNIDDYARSIKSA